MFLYKVKVGNDSTVYSERNMKDKSHPQVAFKWSGIDQVLLPALSGVVKTYV